MKEIKKYKKKYYIVKYIKKKQVIIALKFYLNISLILSIMILSKKKLALLLNKYQNNII